MSEKQPVDVTAEFPRGILRQHWHVYGVVRDASPDAFTPTLGYATKVVSVTEALP